MQKIAGGRMKHCYWVSIILKNFKKPGYSCLDALESQHLDKININGKSVLVIAMIKSNYINGEIVQE